MPTYTMIVDQPWSPTRPSRDYKFSSFRECLLKYRRLRGTKSEVIRIETSKRAPGVEGTDFDAGGTLYEHGHFLTERMTVPEFRIFEKVIMNPDLSRIDGTG
jgi:hypothetical protein